MVNDALDARLPLILLQKEPIGEYWKPPQHRFYACAAGHLLILAPWVVDGETDYSRFHQLNDYTREICEATEMRILNYSDLRCLRPILDFRIIPTVSTNPVTNGVDVSFQPVMNSMVLLEDAMSLIEKVSTEEKNWTNNYALSCRNNKRGCFLSIFGVMGYNDLTRIASVCYPHFLIIRNFPSFVSKNVTIPFSTYFAFAKDFVPLHPQNTSNYV